MHIKLKVHLSRPFFIFRKVSSKSKVENGNIKFTFLLKIICFNIKFVTKEHTASYFFFWISPRLRAQLNYRFPFIFDVINPETFSLQFATCASSRFALYILDTTSYDILSFWNIQLLLTNPICFFDDIMSPLNSKYSINIPRISKLFTLKCL